MLIKPFSSLSKACSLILQEEKRSIGQGFNMIQPANVVAMYMNNINGFHGNQGHNHGGKGGNSKKERLVCTYCGLTSHIADNAISFMVILHVINQKEVTRLWQIKFLQCCPLESLDWMFFLQHWMLVYLLLMLYLPVFCLMLVLNLRLFLPHRIFLVIHLGVLTCKLVHKLPCLNAPFLKSNVSSCLTF